MTHRADARRVTAVVPFLGDSRKDRQTKPRDPVTTRYVAALFEAVGAKRDTSIACRTATMADSWSHRSAMTARSLWNTASLEEGLMAARKQTSSATRTSAFAPRLSRAPVDAPGKRHRKPLPDEPMDMRLGEAKGKHMGQKSAKNTPRT